ncbi:hypothetical protein Tco_1284152 [Tanacetum coccineum]
MMGVLTYFLGFKIKQSERGISINQEKYVKDLLKKYDINGSSVKTPMVRITAAKQNLVLLNNLDEKYAKYYTCSDSPLLTPLCCDDIHDVTPRVSALAGCDKEYLVEFWYTAASNLKTRKVFFSIPSASTKGDIGLNSFRNALGANYLSQSRDYVEPPT